MKHTVEKRLFDVNNDNDVAVFRAFLQTNSWGVNGCPFKVEHPWISIPDMIKDKLVRNLLDVGV